MRYYLDTEFNGFGGELISLALVPDKGDAVYYVFTDFGLPEAWVSENVLPLIWNTPQPIPKRAWDKTAAAMDIAFYLRADSDPVIVSDWPADIRYLCELIEFPAGQMAPIARLKFELVRVDAYPTTLTGAVQHNAWWDAMALREKLRAK